MSEIFEVKRTKLFYECDGCRCEDVGDILSFKGVFTSLGYDYIEMEETIIGFYDYKENCYYWFYEDFDELYLNKINGLNCCSASLNDLEAAINENIDSGTFRLTHVAHDYSLFIKRED